MALGVMQPYLFPYLGYFQLMNCVETYVFCGDFQYMKHGWINRNRIYTDVSRNKVGYFTFSVAKDDYRKQINQRHYCSLKSDCDKLKANLYKNYRNAANFKEAFRVIEEALSFQNDNVACFNMNANYSIARYLGIKARIACTDRIEDEVFWEKFHQLDCEDRMIYLCRYYGEQAYINAIGGTSLYHKEVFEENGLRLGFIRMDDIVYPQFGNEFIPNLSIIDVIMHNKVDAVKILLEKYQIV